MLDIDSREKYWIEIVQGRTSRWHIHVYGSVKWFSLGKVPCYDFLPAYGMERITVNEGIPPVELLLIVLRYPIKGGTC